MLALCCIHYMYIIMHGVRRSLIIAEFLMPEAQQPVIVLIIYSSYLLKDITELQEYISDRTAIIVPVYMQATSL